MCWFFDFDLFSWSIILRPWGFVWRRSPYIYAESLIVRGLITAPGLFIFLDNCLFSMCLYHLWLIRYGQSRTVHCVSAVALSEAAERKGRAQEFVRLCLVLDPCNDERFNPAGCRRNIRIQGSKIWYVVQLFSLYIPTVVLGSFLVVGWEWCLLFLLMASHFPQSGCSVKLSEEFAKGRLSVQEAGMKSSLRMHGSKGSW